MGAEAHRVIVKSLGYRLKNTMHHISKLLLLRLLHANRLQSSDHSIQLAEDYSSISYWVPIGLSLVAYSSTNTNV